MNRTNAFITWFSIGVVALAVLLTIVVYANLGSGRWTAIPVTSPGMGGRPGPGGPNLGPDVLVCVSDLRAHCPDVRGAERLQCLSANLADLSADCRAALTHRM